MKVKLSVLSVMLSQAIDKQRSIVKSLSNSKSNPSVAPNYYKALGHLEAFEAVRDSLKGNSVNLRILMD